MTPAQKNRLTAFSALLKTHGEALTFRTGTVTGVVSRGQPDPYGPSLDLNPRKASKVIVLAASISGGTPKAGEDFTDEGGEHHLIETVTMSGAMVICDCKM